MSLVFDIVFAFMGLVGIGFLTIFLDERNKRVEMQKELQRAKVIIEKEVYKRKQLEQKIKILQGMDEGEHYKREREGKARKSQESLKREEEAQSKTKEVRNFEEALLKGKSTVQGAPEELKKQKEKRQKRKVPPENKQHPDARQPTKSRDIPKGERKAKKVEGEPRVINERKLTHGIVNHPRSIQPLITPPSSPNRES